MATLKIDEAVTKKFPALNAILIHINNLVVETAKPELEEFKNGVFERTRQKYSLESLPQVQMFRSYRDFFWRIGVDPTKIRPAAEALIRRILSGKEVPSINTLVDAYNLASIETGIALAAFDSSKITNNMTMRFSRYGEKFLGIGMEEPMTLSGNEVVVSDDDGLVAVYPYRDADYSKITFDTTDAVLMVCGVPGIENPSLEEAGELTAEYVTRYCTK